MMADCDMQQKQTNVRCATGRVPRTGTASGSACVTIYGERDHMTL